MLLLCIRGQPKSGRFADCLMVDPKRLGASLKNRYANLVLVTDERDLDRVYVGRGTSSRARPKCYNRIWRGLRRKPIAVRRRKKKCKPKGKMNRRDFSKGVSAIIVGSQPGAHRLLATQSAALGVDHEARSPVDPDR